MKHLIFGIFLMISGHTSAGTAPLQGCDPAFLGCAGKIDRIYLHPSGVIKIPPPIGSDITNLNCSLSEGVYLTIKREHPHFKEMYSMLLTAHTLQKDVFLRYVENSSDCEIFYIALY